MTSHSCLSSSGTAEEEEEEEEGNEPVWAYMNEDSSNMVPASERLIAFTESVSASKNKHLGGNRRHMVSVSMAHTTGVQTVGDSYRGL